MPNLAMTTSTLGTTQVTRGILQDMKEEGYSAVRFEPQYRITGENAGGYTKEFNIKIR
jgi:hypothetical protein